MFGYPGPGGVPSPQMHSMYGASSSPAPMMGMPYGSYPMMPPSPQMGMPYASYTMMSQHGSPMHTLSSPRFPPKSSRASSPRSQLGSGPSQPGSGPSQPGSGPSQPGRSPRSQPRSNPPTAHALPVVAPVTQTAQAWGSPRKSLEPQVVARARESSQSPVAKSVLNLAGPPQLTDMGAPNTASATQGAPRLSDSKPVEMTLKLAMDFSTAGEQGSLQRAAFNQSLTEDLSKAAGVAPQLFEIVRVSAGSIIVDTKIHVDSEGLGPHPMLVAAELEKQADQPNSLLRSGVLTRHCECIVVGTVRPGSMGKLFGTENDAEQPTCTTPSLEELLQHVERARVQAQERRPPRKPRVPDSPRSIYSATPSTMSVSEILHIPYVSESAFSFPLFSEQFNSSKPARVSGDTADTLEDTCLTPYQKEPTPRPQHQQASFSGTLSPEYRTVDVPTVGLGLLLEQAWVAKQTHQLSLTDAFVSLDGKNERVWRVQNMAPGYGADSSGLICVGDIVVRVNGQSIPGSCDLDYIAKLLKGPLGSVCDVSLERAIEDFSMYTTTMSASGRSHTSSFSTGTRAARRKAQIVVAIERTHPTQKPEKSRQGSRVVNLIHL